VPNGERRLAAIMYTDIVGYTSLTQRDESSTLQALEKHRSLLRPHFSSHGGREIKTIGDAFLVEFQSALDAVLCAIAVQQMMHDRKVARGEAISLRIGIHVGDVVENGSDILGDAVNIAARIYPLAEPGGICISDEAYKQVRNKSDLPFVSLGETPLKNVTTPIEVFKVQMPWERSATVQSPTFATNRIAILPFRNMSPDPSDEYFAEGMTEEVISTVSGISGLEVISRTSVMNYKGSAKNVEEIGKELKVGSVLEGRFRKAGNKIRVTTQLIEVAKDRHLWAQNYDRNLDDVFEVQSDIARQVADALRVRILTPEKERIERRPTESTTAYALYLKGRYLWNKRVVEDIKNAAEYFLRAIAEDPDFALGHVGLADCILVLPGNLGIEIDPNPERVRNELDKALAIDPNLAEAHASKGLMFSINGNLKDAELEFERAIELKPGYAFAHMWYHLVLAYQTRWDEALAQIERAVELDPLSPVVNLDLGGYYFQRRDYAKALDIWKRMAELHPDYADGHFWLSWAYARMKMYDEIEKEVSTYCELRKVSFPHQDLIGKVWTAFLKDDKQGVRTTLPQLEVRLKETSWSEYEVADMHFYLGDVDEGFQWLERAYSKGRGTIIGIRADEILDGVRNDPRYLDLVKRLGLD